MACDPRKRLGGAIEKTEFFRTLGKLGDIEVLNDANSDIGSGLRALESISNSVRTGSAVEKIWSSFETSLATGANAVLGTVGIDPNAAQDVGSRFNPGVLNRAVGQAETIYDRVRQGNFEVRDVPEAVQDFGNLSQLLGGVFTPKPSQDDTGLKQSNICDPSPWATDLINLAPKHKFMFIVEFVFSNNYVDTFRDLEFAFVIKRTTRPNIQFEYEDVNFYNFRSKVLKRSEYQPMAMTFYDDLQDNALRFYNRYLQIISPVSRGDGQRPLFEESGMTFDQENGINSASIGAVGNTTKTIIHHANIYHLINAGRQVDVYRFESPRLQTMSLDDLDMVDGATGTEVTVEFNYDRVSILPAQDIRDFQSNVTDSTDVGNYPITLENIKAESDQPSTTSDTDGIPRTAIYDSEASGQTVAPPNSKEAAIQAERDAINEAKANAQNPLLQITPPTLPNFNG